MFDPLSERLSSVFRRLSGRARLTEANISEGLADVRTALLAADVNFKVVKEFMRDALDETRVKHMTALLDSMAPQERENPELLTARRRQRIARGAGRPAHEVNALLREFEQLRRMKGFPPLR